MITPKELVEQAIVKWGGCPDMVPLELKYAMEETIQIAIAKTKLATLVACANLCSNYGHRMAEELACEILAHNKEMP